MRLFIVANEAQKKEIRMKPLAAGIDLFFSTGLPQVQDIEKYDVFFILDGNDLTDASMFEQKPVIINSVIKKLSDHNFAENVARINGWPGFLQRPVWEIAGQNKKEIQSTFKKLGWEIIWVKDEPGMITGRIVSMIINEAFYALNENISTVKEIDLAMKLGTNYPFGPFEWAKKIGIDKIYDLLNLLAENDIRCTPSFGRDEIIKNL